MWTAGEGFAAMPEDLRHDADVVVGEQHLGRERVTERVRHRPWPPAPAAAGRRTYERCDRSIAPRIDRRIPGAPAACAQISHDVRPVSPASGGTRATSRTLGGLRLDEQLAVTALAPNADDEAVEAFDDVAPLQAESFGDAEAGPAQELEELSVLVWKVPEELCHLARVEDLTEPAAALGPAQRCGRDLDRARPARARGLGRATP